MKVIVTGGTGFIGRALIERLLARGDTVVALTRNAASARAKLPPGMDVRDWNPPEVGPWTEALNGADAVVNLAGEAVATRPWTDDEKHAILASRVDSTGALVAAIERTDPRPRVLVNGSAIGFYGSRGDETLTEDSTPGTDFLADVVVQWEAAARPVEDLGVRLVLLRSGIVLGSGGGVQLGMSRHGPVVGSAHGALPQMVLPFKLLGGGTMGYPDQWVSWIHIDDEVRLILFALDTEGLRGAVNAAAPQPVPMKTFSQQIGQAVHRPSWVPFLGHILSIVLGQRREFLLASQRVLPAAAEGAGFTFEHPESGEALRSLLG